MHYIGLGDICVENHSKLSLFRFLENEAIGVDIGSISASDVDDSPVKFKFMHLEDEKMFSIDSTSGRIKVCHFYLKISFNFIWEVSF